VLNAKLPFLAAWNTRRDELARRYDAAFAGQVAVRPLARAANTVHAWHQYAVRVLGPGVRDRVLAELHDQRIFAAVHYPTPVHLQQAARDWGYSRGDFPHAEALAAEVLCLPIHPFLADGDADRVAGAVLESAARSA
jgi:dTDP-4-amino-4,6-dideoxygalactose transaminase